MPIFSRGRDAARSAGATGPAGRARLSRRRACRRSQARPPSSVTPPPPPTPTPPLQRRPARRGRGRRPGAPPPAESAGPVLDVLRDQHQHAIRWARTTATSSCGRSFPTIRGRRSGPTATTSRPARATTASRQTVATQKHACVADRAKMLKGEPATEQCVDRRQRELPEQRRHRRQDAAARRRAEHHDGGRRHAARQASSRTTSSTCGSSTSTGRIRRRPRSTGPKKIPVAPYHYLCGGQLTNCVPQPGTERRLDAQGDKIMARLVYRRVERPRVDRRRALGQHGERRRRRALVRVPGRQGPDARQPVSAGHVRARRVLSAGWRARRSTSSATSASAIRSAASPHFAGQRFAGRRPDDPLGQLTLRETVLVEGEAGVRRTRTLRWEDYTQTAIDPTTTARSGTSATTSRRTRRATRAESAHSGYRSVRRADEPRALFASAHHCLNQPARRCRCSAV